MDELGEVISLEDEEKRHACKKYYHIRKFHIVRILFKGEKGDGKDSEFTHVTLRLERGWLQYLQHQFGRPVVVLSKHAPGEEAGSGS